MKKIVRWIAVYETLINVPEGEDEDDEAANILIDVPGSTYQTDTWEVEKIRDATPEEIENESPEQ
jgi:hypothetical protein